MKNMTENFLTFCFRLFVPLLAREFIQILDVGGSNQTLTDGWSMFGFLYGTIPTAPTVIIFASKFGVEEDMVRNKSRFYISGM
jgi:hypothetical protein